MWAKILMAVAMPFVVAVAVGALLVTTHHTKIPPLTLPPEPSPPPSSSPGKVPGPTLIAYQNACSGKIPKPFSGIAANNSISQHVTDFQHITVARITVLEFSKPF